MNLKYINKIKANISIYTSKKTTNILDGTYKSIYKGKSMNFENLREYVINDEIKDIDWKSSARSCKLLVKEYLSEKKHSIMFVMDTGIKMKADSSKHQNKKTLALYSAGTIGYIALKNNDYIGMAYAKGEKIIYRPFKYNLYNLEEYLCEYDKNELDSSLEIEEVLKYINKNILKKMIIFVITDIDGINKVDSKTLKKINKVHDIMFINIDDNYMFGEKIYDLDEKEYIPSMLLKDKELNRIEKEIKYNLYRNNKNRLKRHKINMVTIDSLEKINMQIIKLLEEHKNANNH